MKNKGISLAILIVFVFMDAIIGQQKKRPIANDNGKIFYENDKKMLFGGEDISDHFDISNCELKDDQWHYGIGRERFPALLEPKFIAFEEADKIYKGDERFLYLKIGNESRAYSIADLTRHEVVNDVVDGKKVMAAYCILADLGAVYNRSYGDVDLTFALSGYTYFDKDVWDGLDGFIMWDRETESLWWPLTGQAVSGRLKGTKMKVYDERHWVQTTWSEIRKKDKRVKVLLSGQDFERPVTWERLSLKGPLDANGKSIAPRWGEH